MTLLIVQNDAGTVANANAYILQAFADSYFSERGNAVWQTLTTLVKEQSIIKATDYIDSRFAYKGNPLLDTQSTQFPRKNLFDRYGIRVIGLPTNLKKACCEYAVRASQGDLWIDPKYEESSSVLVNKSISAGSVSKSLGFRSDGSKIINRSYPGADALLLPYTTTNALAYRG